MAVTAHLGSPRRTLPLRWAIHGYVRGVLRVAVKAMFAVVLIGALAPVALVAFGYQPSFLRSDGMAPTMATGDIVIYELVDPASVRVGDIITFANADQGGDPTTARVTEIAATGDRPTFVTKGDAGDTTTPWTLNAQEQVTRVAYHFEGLGRALTLPSTAALGGLALILAIGVIWGGTSIRSRRAAARYW
jgi:signal peptidase I